MQLTCIAFGRGSTVWGGTAVPRECGDRILRHSQFSEGVIISCPDGSIVAESLSDDNDCYTSQLTVTIRPEINGTSITCKYDNGSQSFLLGEYTIIVTSG